MLQQKRLQVWLLWALPKQFDLEKQFVKSDYEFQPWLDGMSSVDSDDGKSIKWDICLAWFLVVNGLGLIELFLKTCSLYSRNTFSLLLQLVRFHLFGS